MLINMFFSLKVELLMDFSNLQLLEDILRKGPPSIIKQLSLYNSSEQDLLSQIVWLILSSIVAAILLGFMLH